MSIKNAVITFVFFVIVVVAVFASLIHSSCDRIYSEIFWSYTIQQKKSQSIFLFFLNAK